MFRRYLHLILPATLVLFALGFFAVNVKMNIFRFNHFDYGKFDLGNMTQMAWYTLHRPRQVMWLTDYFGTNLPRWAMSHVDPILLLFVPFFAVYEHALTLVVIQLVLVISSAFVVYKLALLVLESRLAATFFGFAFLFYPAVGFLTATSGYHGVTAVIPFFLLAFYVFELMYTQRKITPLRLVLFFMFLTLTMMGKEQLPLYVLVYGAFIIVFRLFTSIGKPVKGSIKAWLKLALSQVNVKIGLSMVVLGFIWFYLAFFVIIPNNAHYRVEGFVDFAQSLSISEDSVAGVDDPNYFLRRYEAFGDSYVDIVIGMLTRPKDLTRVLFGGDRPENLRQTLEPMLYTPILYPHILVIALPDFVINYGTTQGGIGTAEIYNHRISMIIPVLFISSIYAVGLLGRLFTWKIKIKPAYVVSVFAGLVLFANMYTSVQYENPVYLWITQAVQKRIPLPEVFAKEDTEVAKMENLQIGDRFNLSKLETKDRECAEKVVRMIPPDASLSGPDYLGAHLPLRETYAIFPALYNSADYVIVDIFAQKILRILELDVGIVKDVVADMIKDPNYQLVLGCGNLFVFQNVGAHEKTQLLPLQEKFVFEETTDFEIFESLTVADYQIPQTIVLGEPELAKFTYVKREEKQLPDYFLFMSFISEETGELYQVANLPSFALNQLRNWREDRYYEEEVEIALPEFLDPGIYRVFIGMTNNIRTRSIYLGDIEVLP